MGISQSELARSVGISPSYMNLIEWNKRQIGGALLHRIADRLEIDRDDLDTSSENRLLNSLNEIASLPASANLGVEQDQTGEFIGRFPGWANAVASLARSGQEANLRAQSLSDRLSNDPFLGETVHRMLTRVSAIRSAADILKAYDDITDEERNRFYAIIDEESHRLSSVGEALAAYLDKSDTPSRTLTPVDEVESLFEANGNRFAQIEDAAEKAHKLLREAPVSNRNAYARALAQDRFGDIISDIIDTHAQLETISARERAHRALLEYAVGAVQMPEAEFGGHARALRYDIEAICDSFSADFHTVCLRLTALRPEADVPRFGYYRANAAGGLIRMLGLDTLTFPRYTPACPLWVLYRAQQSPETVIRQLAHFPTGSRFVFVARARNTGAVGFGVPRQYVTDMIAMTEADARLTVYAPDATTRPEQVGPSCRLCPRDNCVHRVEDPLSD
ncbi:MAG: DUF2083 domain-containing protein [Alphaproteobacteria bacterium]|nr:DUF2083 domain-containing protein [Alphaproteobacteria bacterium]